MDRDYWRCEATSRLIEEARSKGCELCIVLGERLEEVAGEVEAAEVEADDLTGTYMSEVANLTSQIEELGLQLLQREKRIEQLEAQINKETKK
jgi:hypothetical protein